MTHIDRPHTDNGKLTLDEQFRELADMYRARVRRYNYTSQWFEEIFPRWGRMSPKMCCWLARESFDEMSRHFGGDNMAQKAENAGKDGKKDFDWGFVNVQLSDEEREAARLDFADTDALWETLILALKDGYKVTLSFDAETESYCAALSGTNCGKPNERLTLTAWGANETDALCYLLYKHVTKLGFVWQKAGAKQARLG